MPLQLTVYDNTAMAGSPIHNVSQALGAFALPSLHSATLMGQLVLPQWSRFSLTGSAGYARLWVDDHLLIAAPLHPSNTSCELGACGGTPPSAAYAIPVPFLPGASFSKIRLELTTSIGALIAGSLSFLANGSAVPDAALSATVAESERRYFAERQAQEFGWNTWLSGDMLTHAYLPHGIALSLALVVGQSTVRGLCANGPSCDQRMFPAKHGLHGTRGEYTEVEHIDVGGAAFKVDAPCPRLAHRIPAHSALPSCSHSLGLGGDGHCR